MSGNFPTARDLLPEITDIGSDTFEGQKAMAEWIRDFVTKHGLGAVTLHPYPAGSPMADKGLSNITIDLGDSNSTNEILGITAHYDVVPVSSGQKKGFDPQTGNFYQRGSADMLGQVAGLLLALNKISVADGRKIRVLLTPQEEWFSQGAHAAGHDSNNLMKGVSAMLNLDINVDTRTSDAPELVRGGVGRVAMNMRAKTGLLLGADIIAAQQAIRELQIPENRSGDRAVFRPAIRETSFTPGASEFGITVHHSNENLTPEALMDSTRTRLVDALGHDNFELAFEDRGGVPFSSPWMTESQSTFVRTAGELASAVQGKQVSHTAYGRSSDAQFLIHAASKPSGRTATTRLGPNGSVPAIGYYASGEDVHGPMENVDPRSVDNLALFIRRLAAHQKPLTE